uniref:Uncharacterized protein n=1 Tax=Sphaerodactylus townsendi TaxID=933632 RepID=A0ACB8FBC9_9SAUR
MLLITKASLCLGVDFHEMISWNEDDYNDFFYLDFDNEIENPPTEETISCDCQQYHTEWDKLFITLENSQMKQNMLLHSLDEILKVELQKLRGELLQCVENFSSLCITPTTQTTSRISNQLDQMLVRKHKEAGNLSGMLHESEQGKVLQEILQLSRNVSNRLSNLEHAWQRKAELDTQQKGLPEKDYMTRGDNFILNSLWQELQETKAELKESHKKKTRNLLPSGCETALLFPMRSKKIFASVHPTAEMMLSSFTVCMWVKVTEMLDKTIVFSYGTKRNPYEIQLYLSYDSAVLTVSSDLNKIVAQNVISSGQWTHFCGIWNSVNGNASLWVSGKRLKASSDIAEEHIIPDGGILQIGQEKNGCCVGGGFNESLAFSGKITGFNIWNRVLSEKEITRQSGEEACNIRGDIVGWGVTEILPHGGAQYVFSF